MQTLSFVLKPFSPVADFSSLQLGGSISRQNGILSVRHELRGKTAEIILPPPAESPARRHGLWRETCFELFLAAKGADRYWEINLSPSGDWNVYAFDAYRVGMREEPAIAALPFRTQVQPDFFQLALAFDLPPSILPDASIECAVSAVIKDRSGRTSCWALTHCGTQPDFHRRDSFLLRLPQKDAA